MKNPVNQPIYSYRRWAEKERELEAHRKLIEEYDNQMSWAIIFWSFVCFAIGPAIAIFLFLKGG